MPFDLEFWIQSKLCVVVFLGETVGSKLLSTASIHSLEKLAAELEESCFQNFDETPSSTTSISSQSLAVNNDMCVDCV